MKPLFEDVCENEYGHWVRICDEHSRILEIKYLGNMECEYNCSAEALCDVLGCRNAADFYIDFYHWDESLRATKDSLSKPTEFGRFDRLFNGESNTCFPHNVPLTVSSLGNYA